MICYLFVSLLGNRLAQSLAPFLPKGRIIRLNRAGEPLLDEFDQSPFAYGFPIHHLHRRQPGEPLGQDV